MTQDGWVFEIGAAVALLALTALLSGIYRPLLEGRPARNTVVVVATGMVSGIPGLFLSPGGEPHPVPLLALVGFAVFIATIAQRSLGAPLVPVALFAVLWGVIVFLPVTLFLPDFAASIAGSADGFLDHAGALAALVAAGAAALGVGAVNRGSSVTPAAFMPSRRPAGGAPLLLSLLVVVGIVVLVAVEFAFDEYTSIIAVNSVLVVVLSLVSWVTMDAIRGVARGSWRFGAAIVAGLAAAAPSAAFLAPLSAVVLGLLVGVCVSIALREREAMRPASRFVFVAHGYPAALGLLYLGFVAEHRGAIFTGQPGILLAQLAAPLLAIVYSAAVSAVLWTLLRRLATRR